MRRLTPARLDVLLERARAVRVLVIGDAMLDVYLRGGASRISPEAPVPVVKVEEEWRALGGAANVATNVVALGAACGIVACTGADRAGEELRAELARAGISDAGVVTVRGRPTTVKTRVLVRHQQVARYDHEVEDDADAEAVRALNDAIAALAPACDVVVVEDYNKGVLTPPVVRQALDIAAGLGRPLVVDPKARGFFGYAGATVFKPNLIELGAALREPVHADDPAWMERTRQLLGCQHLLLTLGEHGMALMAGDGEFLRVPTVARSVYDVSGAGDTVTAAVAVALAAGATPAEAAVLANHAAGIGVGKAGVAAVTPDELRAVVQAQHDNQDREALAHAGARDTPQGRSGWPS
jgi:D-beta-D-heptose 7-phosphate kinase/D-beta-D-heptose 1-phosphate adenosyltransferase